MAKIFLKDVKHIDLEPVEYITEFAKNPGWSIRDIGCLMILDLYLYASAGKLKFDLKNLASLCRLTEPEFTKVWSNIESKYKKSGNKGARYIHRKRITKELKAARKRMQVSHNKGVKGMRARYHNNSSTNSHTIIKSNQTKQVYTYTQEQVKNSAVLIGISEQQAEVWFHHYAAQGFVFGNGQPITDLSEALKRWRNNQYKFEKRGKDERTGANQSISTSRDENYIR